MGKDKEMSKEELALENERLTREVARVQTGFEEVEGALKKTAEAYEQSKAAFSVSRYGHLKDIIKQLISEEFLKKVHSLTESGPGGVATLMRRAQELATNHNAAATGAKDQPPASASKSGGGKLSGLFRKIKQATGFAEADPRDIRLLDKDDIRRDNERKKRELKRLNARGQRAVNALQKLNDRYQASKKHAPPKRYLDLKDMIKDTLAEGI